MAYFGRTPKKPGQLGVSGAGRTLAGFGPASGGMEPARVGTLGRVVSKGRTARPDTPARMARQASAGRSQRTARAAR